MTGLRVTGVCTLICFGLTCDRTAAQAPDRSDSSTFDVLFLSSDAPMWLRIEFGDGRVGLRSVRERYASLLIDRVDADGDGLAGPEEAVNLPAAAGPKSPMQKLEDRWRSFDSAPSDNRLSATEYLQAIEDEFGPMVSVRSRPPILAQSVQLLPRLDRDGDRSISASEVRYGPEVLTPFDFDDDGTYSPAELQPFPQSMVDATSSGFAGDEGPPFVLFDAGTDLNEVAARVHRVYSGGHGVPLTRSGLSEFAFAELDTDEDGVLNESEIAVMLSRPRPVAILQVDLAGSRVALIRPRGGSPLVDVLPAESSRRLALRIGSEAIEFSARDNRYAASDQINLLKIRFLQGDADKNGYLGADEFATVAGMPPNFDEVDADGDGKLFIDELDRFVRLDAYLAQCAVEMEVETVEKPLFRLLDANVDRRLSPREFADGMVRLQEFDEDGDGTLSLKELDLLRRFRVRFRFVVPEAVRPERNMQMTAQRRMPVVTQSTATGPEWFQRMDRNRDGDVTWREFLGPRDAFESLDADGNGWIDDAEASAGSG